MNNFWIKYSDLADEAYGWHQYYTNDEINAVLAQMYLKKAFRFSKQADRARMLYNW